MPRYAVVIALPLCLLVMSQFLCSQVGIVHDNTGSFAPSLYVVDPPNRTYSSITPAAWVVGQYVSKWSRGHVCAPDESVYVGSWWIKGIAALNRTTGVWTTIVTDPVGTKLGAPYQPVVNNEAVGGLGLWCVSGNTYGGTTHRNAFLVNVPSKTYTVDAIFGKTCVPMSDAFQSPNRAGEMIGVGFWNGVGYDKHVYRIPVLGKPATITPAIVTTLRYGCYYDSFLHEDKKLYCYTPTNPCGLEAVDLSTGTTKTAALLGGYGEAVMWEEPWEAPGRKAYVLTTGLHHSTGCFEIDLATWPPVIVASKFFVRSLSYYPCTARSTEENQLISYWAGPAQTARVFHLDFFSRAAGKMYVLAPSLLGHGGPTVLNGLELWVVPDGYSLLAAWNVLPGAAGQTVGTLSPAGTADVRFDIGVRAGIEATWIALALDGSRVVDISNPIIVKM